MLVIRRLLSVLKRKFVENFYRNIPVTWIKKGENTGLLSYLPKESIAVPRNKIFPGIEAIAYDTNKQGPQDLWSGYQENNDRGATRVPNDVRTNRLMGEFYSHLVQRAQPGIIVEFGAAFGVSGMYFLSGLESYSGGKLLSFEPNVAWAEIARRNLSKISDKYELVSGTFEENIRRVLPAENKIDLAFIDAIHTKEFVMPQLDIVVGLANPGALIILDDINFSDDMRECWNMVANDPRFCSSAKLGDRVGIVELAHE